MKKLLAILIVSILCLSCVSAFGEASASDWPTGNMTLLVPASPGGGTDMIARIFSQTMTEITGKSFVVVNDNSGAGTVVSEKIRNGKPDSNELLFTNTGMTRSIADGTYPHPFTEFTVLGCVTTQGRETGGIWVRADSRFKTLSDLVDYGKTNPLMSGVNGVGGMATQVLFDNQVGIDTIMVDAGSDADRVTALMGGNIDTTFINTISAKAYAESGDLRCLVILGSERSEFMPDVPTMIEEGYEAVYPGMYILLCGAPGMDANDVARITGYLKEACANEGLQESYRKMGIEWEYKTPEETLEIIDKCQQDSDAAYQLLVEKGLM